jgi:hypothetical protein
MLYEYNGGGGSIGSINRKFSNRRVDDVPSSMVMSMEADVIDNGTGGFYGPIVYGWTGESPDGVWIPSADKTEFYVVLEHRGRVGDIKTGTLVVDKVTYEVYQGLHGAGPGLRLKAVRIAGPMPKEIRLKPFLEYWRANNGMPNLWLSVIGWGIELKGGGTDTHRGSFHARSIILPE